MKKIKYFMMAIGALLVLGAGCQINTGSNNNNANAGTTTTNTTTNTTPTTVNSNSTNAITTTTTVKEFDLVAKQFNFEPNTITVNQGDTVVLNITGADVPHGFSLPDFNINETITPNQTKTIEFVANKAGTFTFSCSVVCGTGHDSMKGELVVTD